MAFLTEYVVIWYCWLVVSAHWSLIFNSISWRFSLLLLLLQKKIETIKKMFISIAEGIDQEPVVNHILNISKFKLMNSLLDQLVVKSAKFNFGYFGFVRLVEFIEFIDRTSIVSFKFFLCRLFFSYFLKRKWNCDAVDKVLHFCGIIPRQSWFNQIIRFIWCNKLGLVGWGWWHCHRCCITIGNDDGNKAILLADSWKSALTLNWINGNKWKSTEINGNKLVNERLAVELLRCAPTGAIRGQRINK